MQHGSILAKIQANELDPSESVLKMLNDIGLHVKIIKEFRAILDFQQT